MSNNQTHKFYDQAVRAYNWSSFSPEKRATADCAWYDEICQKLKGSGAEWALEKFTRLFLHNLGAKSRCASPMITGPANFPVARMQKYNRWEENSAREMIDFVNKALKPKFERKEIDYKIEAKEYTIGEVTVIQNIENNRLQLAFPGKPCDEMISTLKSNGYKWSPRFKTWQRQLTPMAINSLRYVFPQSRTAE